MLKSFLGCFIRKRIYGEAMGWTLELVWEFSEGGGRQGERMAGGVEEKMKVKYRK
jgi:hypothetical protein